MTGDPCPWCSHPTCTPDTPRSEHHYLCCVDGPRQPCWGPSASLTTEQREMLREDHE